MRDNIVSLKFKRDFISLVISLVLIPAICLAVPAPSNFITVTQPDGGEIKIKVCGDEKINWYENEAGYTLLRDADNYFVYAHKDVNGDLVPSSHRYYSDDSKLKISPAQVAFLNSTPKHLFYSTAQVKTALRSWKTTDNLSDKTDAQLQAYNRTKIEGTRKYLIILMSYPDKPFTRTREDFEALFNSTNYKGNSNEGSVKDYFTQNSYGTFTPEFVVVGPYEASHEMKYYEYNGSNWSTSRAPELIREAIEQADEDVDFSEFDNDDNYLVDAVTVVYAGMGAEHGVQNAIWAHASRLSSGAPNVDGKFARDYCCAGELIPSAGQTTMSRIGTFCHEFNHTLGSPDYYDTDYGSNGNYTGLGDWCIMSSGNYNGGGGCPAPINSFQKWMYGWLELKVLTATDNTVNNMPPTITNPVAYRIDTETEDEMFILENRQPIGFDKEIPGHGLLILHAHPSLAEKLNTNQDGDLNVTHPQMLYPVCAMSDDTIPSGVGTYGVINHRGCTFPGSTGKTSFSNITVPAAISWNKNMATPLTNIREIDTFISFNCNIFNIPYKYDFTELVHYANYQSINPVSSMSIWTREAIADNQLMRLRGFQSTDATPHTHYLFLPAFSLDHDDIYHFRFDARVYSNSYPGNIKLYLLRSDNTEDEKELLFEFDGITSTEFETKEFNFNVDYDGTYYIAIVADTKGDVTDIYLDNINIGKTVGIYETPNELEMRCYPNPAGNHVIIDNFSNEKIEKIEITDITGRVLISNTYSSLLSNDSATSTFIDISSLLSGNYYVLITTSEGSKKIKRLIKN